MIFSSAIFLFLFLPIVLGIYFAAPVKFKNLILLVFSLIFYSWGEKIIVLVMLTSTIVDYYCGILIENGHRKLGLISSVVANIGLLGFFKYANFAFENLYFIGSRLGISVDWISQIPEIALPIGISFYTFQTMSYTIDVYKGNVKANRNYLDFATYVTMFPQLVAGPIIRYRHIYEQLTARSSKWADISEGIQRFIIGLTKKVLIANSFAVIADEVFSIDPDQLNTQWVWIGTVAYAFQIYFDFSGYSDMAIGLGRVFGFRFLENFNYPYISQSIQDFWRRWHISLSTWFRDYLYFSLGGNRKGAARTYVNLFIVFFITGLWHGASWNFIIWGLYHGLFLVIERIGFGSFLKTVPRVLRHIYTLLIVLVGWVLFRADTMDYAINYIEKMFVWTEAPGNAALYLSANLLNIENLFWLVIAVLFSTPIYHSFGFAITVSKIQKPALASMAILLQIILFVVCSSYIAADSYNPFIYFRF